MLEYIVFLTSLAFPTWQVCVSDQLEASNTITFPLLTDTHNWPETHTHTYVISQYLIANMWPTAACVYSSVILQAVGNKSIACTTVSPEWKPSSVYANSQTDSTQASSNGCAFLIPLFKNTHPVFHLRSRGGRWCVLDLKKKTEMQKEKGVVSTGRREGEWNGPMPGTQFSDLYSNQRQSQSQRGAYKEVLNS